MSTFTIKQGHHAHTLFPVSFLPWFRGGDTVTMSRRVTFYNSCQYDSPAYHAEDVNKLWGLSFGLYPHAKETYYAEGQMGDPFFVHDWVSSEHWNSARFGWVWSVSKQAWKQLAYCYADGVKNWDAQLRYPEVALVAPGQEVDETIMYHRPSGRVTFVVSWLDEATKLIQCHTTQVQLPPNLPMRGWQLGFWFGGELSAPHKMSCSISRI